MWKFLRRLLISAACVIVPLSVGAAGLQYFLGPTSSTNPINFPNALPDLNQLISNLNALLNLNQSNSSILTLKPEGVFYSSANATAATTGNQTLASGTEATLGFITVPANSFDTAGRKIKVRAVFSTAANNNAKVLKLYWNPGTLALPGTAAGANGSYTALSTGILSPVASLLGFSVPNPTNGGTFIMEMTITKTATANQQLVSGWVISQALTYGTGATFAAYFNGLATAVETSPITILATGLSGIGTANDVVLDDFQAEYAN